MTTEGFALPHPGTTIRGVSNATGLTLRAVRYYEIIGLLVPPRDRHGQRRYFELEQLKLGIIATLRRGGLRLSDIRDILGACPGVAQQKLAVEKLEARLAELGRAKAEAEIVLRAIASEGIAAGLQARGPRREPNLSNHQSASTRSRSRDCPVLARG